MIIATEAETSLSIVQTHLGLMRLLKNYILLTSQQSDFPPRYEHLQNCQNSQVFAVRVSNLSKKTYQPIIVLSLSGYASKVTVSTMKHILPSPDPPKALRKRNSRSQLPFIEGYNNDRGFYH